MFLPQVQTGKICEREVFPDSARVRAAKDCGLVQSSSIQALGVGHLAPGVNPDLPSYGKILSTPKARDQRNFNPVTRALKDR